MNAGCPGLLGTRSISLSIGRDTTILGLPLLTWIVLIVILAAVIGLVYIAARKRKRRKIVANLQKQRLAMEKAEKDLFAERKADDIRQAVLQPGKPTTVLPEGKVAYTEAGEMLVFKSTPAMGDKDVISSAVGGREGRGAAMAPPTWSAQKLPCLIFSWVSMPGVSSPMSTLNKEPILPRPSSVKAWHAPMMAARVRVGAVHRVRTS